MRNETDNRRSYWLDCVRGYSILLVCLCHACQLEPVKAATQKFLAVGIDYYFKGDVGVAVFYALSGYLVTRIVYHDVQLSTTFRQRSKTYCDFLLRRIFRLQPTFILFLLSLGVMYRLFGVHEEPLSWPVLVLPVSYLYGGPYITWHLKTLHVEEAFYLLIGAFAVIVGSRLPRVLWAVLVLSLGSRAVLGGFDFLKIHIATEIRTFAGLSVAIDPLVIGSLAGIYGQAKVIMRLKLFCSRRPVIKFACCAIAILTVGVLRRVFPFTYLFLATWPTIMAVISVTALFCAPNRQSMVAHPVINHCGRISYGLYLFQQFAFAPHARLYGRFSWWWFLFIVTLVGLVVEAWFKGGEEPLRLLGARLFPRLANIPLTPNRHSSQFVKAQSATAEVGFHQCE